MYNYNVYFPTSVCDLNGDKKINDGKQHQRDDKMCEKKRKKSESDKSEIDSELSKRPRRAEEPVEINRLTANKDTVDDDLVSNYKRDVVTADMPVQADTEILIVTNHESKPAIPKNSIQNFFKKVAGSGDSKESRAKESNTIEVDKCPSSPSMGNCTADEMPTKKADKQVKATVGGESHASSGSQHGESGCAIEPEPKDNSAVVVNGVEKRKAKAKTKTVAAEAKVEDCIIVEDNKEEEKRSHQTPTISCSLFRKKKRGRPSPKVAAAPEIDSDTSVNMESLENSPVKALDNKAAEVVVRMSEITASSPKVSPSPASTDDTNVKPPSKQSTSNLSTPSRPNAFTLLMKKKTPIVDTVGKENSR